MVVKLPGYEVLGGRGSLQSGRAVASVDTTAVGKGIAALGQGIEEAGAHIAKVKNAEGELDVLKARSEYARGRIELEDGFNKDQDWRNYGKRFDKEGGALRDRAASLIRDPKQREVFRLSIADDEALARSRINARASALEKDEGRAGLTGLLEKNRETALDEKADEATRTKLIGDTSAAIDAAERAGYITEQEAQKLRTDWPREYERVKLKRDIQRDRAGVQTELEGERMPQASKNVYEGLIRRGWSPTAAAGITGALMTESRLDPTIGGDKEGGKPTSFGLAQWREGRLDNLKAFADAKGKPWTDVDVQLDFLDEELRGKQGDAGAARAGQILQKAGSVEEAAEAMMHFERPRHYTPENPRKGLHFDRRLRNAQAVAAGKAGVMSRYKYLTEEDRLNALAAAEAEERQEAAAARVEAREAAMEQTAQRTARRDSYTLEIEKRSLTDPNTFLNDPLLDDGDKASLLERYKSEFKKETDGIAAVQAVSTAQPGQFNRFDSEDRKTVDTAYEAVGGPKGLLEGDQTAVQRLGAITAQTNIVPQAAVETLRNGLVSRAPEVVERSLEVSRAIIERDPNAFDGAEGAKEITDAATRYRHLTREQGVPEKDAANIVREIISPSDPARRATLEKTVKPTMKATLGKTDADVANIAMEATGLANADTFLESNPAPGATAGQQAQIAADFREFFEIRFLESGDPDDAKRMAAGDMKRIYGLTRVSGQPVLMKYAPELIYPKVGGSHEYLGKQVLRDVREVLNDPKVNQEDISLGWDSRTAAQFDAFKERQARIGRGHPRDRAMTTKGLEPDYRVVVRRRIDGQEVFVPLPGGLFRFDPDEARGRLEKRVERQEAQDAEIRDIIQRTEEEHQGRLRAERARELGLPEPSLTPGGIQLPGGP